MQIAIVVYPGFTALDVVGPYEVLHFLPGADIRFVWHEVGPVVADTGVLLLGATHTFDETPSPDIVLVPGGSASVFLQGLDDALLNWLRQVSERAAWMTSVCAGSTILGAAGLLRGRRATSHWQALAMLKTMGAEAVSDERVVIDGNLMTSAGVSAGIDMALRLVAEIAGEARARAITLAIEYAPEPPFPDGVYAEAAAGTKARAVKLLAKDSINGRHVAAGVRLAWRASIDRVRAGTAATTVRRAAPVAPHERS